ncbi:MAG: acyl-CoA dehydrogenase family protein [Acidimicrobiia bacterium]|nr:acyl-CoA dehydrogenase family protein [Acidimicrobiia bacterium]
MHGEDAATQGRQGGPAGAERTPALDATRSVLDVVAAHRSWAEDHARMAAPVVEAAGAAGLFRMGAPAEYGGLEAPLPDQLAAHELLGRADPTLAWCVTNSGVAARIAAYLEPGAAALVYGEPGSVYGFSNVAGAEARPVDGGFELSGRWPVVSGAHDVAWAVLGATVTPPAPEPGGQSAGAAEPPDGRPDVRWMLVPAADLVVEDTWADANAMRGSDSCAVRVDGAFVPAELAHSWSWPRRIDRPLFRLAHTSVTSASTAAICLGVASGALDSLVDILAATTSTLDGTAPRDWPNIGATVAEQTAALRAARSALHGVAAEVWHAVVTDGQAPPRSRAEMFAVADHAMHAAITAVSRAYVCGTAKALRRGHPLDLALRDVHGMAVNWERLRRLGFDAGRVLVGEEPRFRAL